MTPKEVKEWFNTKPIEFVIRENYELSEDKEYIYTLENKKIIYKHRV